MHFIQKEAVRYLSLDPDLSMSLEDYVPASCALNSPQWYYNYMLLYYLLIYFSINVIKILVFSVFQLQNTDNLQIIQHNN